jgi:hypothetical protein
MDELTMFAELRPDDTLTEADLDTLRSELFPTVARPSDNLDEGQGRNEAVEPLAAARPVAARRLPSRVALAAAAVAVVGLGGIWVVADRQTEPAPTAPAAQPPSEPIATTDPSPGIYDMPLIGFSEPGWTVTSAYDESNPARRVVVLLTDAGFDGPWADIKVSGSAETVVTVPVGDTTVNVNGQTANVTEIDNGVILRWSDGLGHALEAFGWQMDLDQTAALAQTAKVTDAGITIDPLPTGASLADTDATDALGRVAGYRFTHTDGREVEVTLTPGGERGLYQRQGSPTGFDREGRTEIMVGDEPATIVDYNDRTPTSSVATAGDAPSPGGEYRVDILRGFWTWEFNTSRFESAQDVIDLVAGSSVVDADTWHASLADNIVPFNERKGVIDALLVGVPLPPDFHTDPVTAGNTEDRYQLIAEVSGAVVCGWFDEWSNARAAGDTAREDAAAAAITSSRNWSMLNEIADQGAWAQAVWGLIDHINANPNDTPPVSTPDGARSTFGCDDIG